jgi:hypothetical protein
VLDALPEFRDLLPVVGWNDKAFRCLAEILPVPAPEPCTMGGEKPLQWPLDHECSLRGRRCRYREDERALELYRNGELLYRWQKGAAWAETCAAELRWK